MVANWIRFSSAWTGTFTWMLAMQMVSACYDGQSQVGREKLAEVHGGAEQACGIPTTVGQTDCGDCVVVVQQYNIAHKCINSNTTESEWFSAPNSTPNVMTSTSHACGGVGRQYSNANCTGTYVSLGSCYRGYNTVSATYNSSVNCSTYPN